MSSSITETINLEYIHPAKVSYKNEDNKRIFRFKKKKKKKEIDMKLVYNVKKILKDELSGRKKFSDERPIMKGKLSTKHYTQHK